MDRKTGWLPIYDKERADAYSTGEASSINGQFVWQPCVQTSDAFYSLEVWFKTEKECDDFIRKHLIGRGTYPERQHQ